MNDPEEKFEEDFVQNILDIPTEQSNLLMGIDLICCLSLLDWLDRLNNSFFSNFSCMFLNPNIFFFQFELYLF